MKRLLFVVGMFAVLGGGCGAAPTVTPVSVPAAPAPSVEAPSATATTFVSNTTTLLVPTVAEPLAPVVVDAEPLSVAMTSGNFFFDPTTISASPGQQVSISFTDNEGSHTFVIDEIGLKKTIATGTVVTFTAPTLPGSYAFYCDIGAHRKLGMEGVLIVK